MTLAEAKEQVYTLRWTAMKIARLTNDPELDRLALQQIEITSSLLGEAIPEEFRTPEPVRPDSQPVKPPQAGNAKVWPLGEKALWYPDAVIRKDLKKSAKGEYPKKYPYGAIVHFTAGHYEGGTAKAIDSIEDSPYFFCCIGIDGKLVQVNPFNQWGYHAGESAWTIGGKKVTGVSNLLVGIEMNNPGRLVEKNGKYYAYFDTKFKNPIKNVRVIKKNTDNILAGAYMPYTEEQEQGLVEFLLFMKANNPDVFDFDYVLGHDEVAGPKGIGRWRKNDPGGALSMTMTEFRAHLRSEYKKRYG